jgi:four helix bundle protein
MDRDPSTRQHNHRKLLVWEEAMNLVESVYQITTRFPKEEVFGLTAQLWRSAVSVPSNIAEGAGRNSSKELVQFLGIASGSLAELDTQLEIASRLGYVEVDAGVFQQASWVGQLLVALRRSLKNRDS